MNIQKEYHVFADIDLIEKEAKDQFEAAMNPPLHTKIYLTL